MMKRIHFQIAWVIVVLGLVFSCTNTLTFPDIESPNPPQVKEASAKLLWIGPDYKVAFTVSLEDPEGIAKVVVKNGEWKLNQEFTVNNQTSVVLKDTFLVWKDANKTEHELELLISNKAGGVIRAKADVEDLSAENQIPGYNPDELPPAIEIFKPTVTKFYGLTNDPVTVEVDAAIADEEIASLEVRVWGETMEGESFMEEDVLTPATEGQKKSYLYNRTFSLPAGKTGEYQYIVKSTDASGNKITKGGNITVGFMDRLYLSDAENADEVANQGYDHYGACRGVGTLLSMKKQGANTFVTDYYYRNEPTDNIRFVAFLGSDRPFNSNQSQVKYTIDGPNVLASRTSDPGKVTADLAEAGFKLPVSQKGYYHISVDMTTRTVTATPYTPAIPVDAVKFPGWSDANPWPYMAVTGTTVVGTAAWSETATSPKLTKEAEHPYLYSGTFQTNGSSSNMSLNAPLAALGGDIWGKGWFRLKAGRSAMRDDYNDLITIVAPVGPSSGGANWGFSLSPVGTYKATYDLALQRFRVVKVN